MGRVLSWSWPSGLRPAGCIFIGVRWAQAHLDSLAGKEQTVGDRGTQNHRSPEGGGWVAEAEQMTFRLRIPNRPNLGKIEGGPFMARERVWPMLKRTVSAARRLYADRNVDRHDHNGRTDGNTDAEHGDIVSAAGNPWRGRSGDARVRFSLQGRTDTFQTTVLGKVLR